MSDILSISWSSLLSFSQCKQKGYLQKTDHRNPSMDLRNFFHGTVVDRAMRRWLESEDRQSGDMASWIDGLIDSEIKEAKNKKEGVVRWKSQTDRAEMRDYCIELVNRLEPILEKEILPYKFWVASRFKVAVQIPWLDGSPTWIYLTGETDLVVYNGGYVVWDLKATSNNDYWRKMLGQLVFYDLAIDAMHGEPTVKVGFIQPLCDQRVLPFEVTDEARSQMWNRIQRMASDFWLNDCPPKSDSSDCNYCSVKHACSKYKGIVINGKRKMPFGDVNVRLDG